jgi:hypothetical protein
VNGKSATCASLLGVATSPRWALRPTTCWSTWVARVALYRDLLAVKWLLVVLDSAATAEQVVPLPGDPACAVLVIGRERLGSLIDRHNAHLLQLGTLTGDEAGRRSRLVWAKEPARWPWTS